MDFVLGACGHVAIVSGRSLCVVVISSAEAASRQYQVTRVKGANQ